MKRKILLPLIAVMVVAGLVVGCAAPAPPPSPAPAPAPTPAPKAEPVVLSCVSFFPPQSTLAKVLWIVTDAINERAKGELIIDILGGQEVIAGADMGMGVKRGVIDIAFLPSGYYEGLVSAASLIHLSQISAEEERERGAHDFLAELHKEAGLFYLGRGINPGHPQFFMSISKGVEKRIETPYDLAGLKLGASSLHASAFGPALGMTFTLIPLPDAYTALERGVVDAHSAPAQTSISFGYYEVTKYRIDHLYFMSDCVGIMNLDKWNRLPEHLQNLILDTYIETEPEMIRAAHSMLEAASNTMLDAGVEFITFSPSDAEWYLETIYEAEWGRQVKKYPEMAPRVMELLSK